MQYLSLFLFSMLFLLNDSNKKFFFIFYCLLLISFSFFNQEGSWDYYGYLEYYNCAIDASCIPKFEFSYKIIALICSSISQVYGFEITLLFYIGLSLFIKVKLLFKHSLHIGAAIFSYVCYAYYMHELTQIRAALSIAFCWLAYDAYLNKKGGVWLFFCYMAIGVFFHTSALLAIIVIVAYHVKTKYLLFLSYASIMMGSITGDLIYGFFSILPSDRIQQYLSSMGNDVYATPLFALYPVIILFTVTMQYIFRSRIVVNKWLVMSCNACLAGVIIYFLSYKIPVIPLRALEFLSTLYPFVFSSLFKMKGNSKSVVQILITAIFILLFLNLSVKNNTRMDMIYKWQRIDIRYMTESQIKQYREFN